MPDDRGTIRQVAWTELFPWLELVRTFRLAIQARFLLLAAVGLLLTFAGWWFAATLFSGSEEPELQNWLTHYGRGPWINAPYEPSVNELRDTAPEIPGPEQLNP